ncbi:MAG: Eco57I restriction-modification methylase domain-containing protein [Clostridia bacterium]|nr:Eco57I restriction-modification methylase domain-containing protein [Clostridia bacterium]
MKDLSTLDSLITGRVEPHIYAFTTNTIPNYLKVGDTYRPVSKRLNEWRDHFPNLEKKFEGSAKITDDVYFRDFAVHQFLETDRGRTRLQSEELPAGLYYSKEFFKAATVDDVREAIEDINEDYREKAGKYHYYDATTQLPTTEKYASSGMWFPRPNQQATIDAFKQAVNNGRTHLLMYAVMRFGKSFTSMCCAKEMGAKLVVVVSAKADVRDEWRKTVESAENFRNDYEFFSSADLENNYSIITDTLDHPTEPKKVVVFLTLQDLQGENIKDKHAQIFGRKIDLLLVDETHFGARAEKYGAVLRASQGEKLSKEEKYAVEDILESTKEFDVNVTVHLSGTPYRILMSDEFDREQDLIAFYQFTDIVREQEEWDRDNFAKSEHEQKEEWENPYFGFPQMIRFAFNPNESARKRMAALRESGMSDAFSALFKPRSVGRADDGTHKLFIHEQEILELLEVIDGSKDDEELLGFLDYEKIKDGNMCRHVVVVLPYCASCDALEALIRNNADKFKNLNGYEIINISGVDNPNRYKKPSDIKRAISKCEAEGKKTITLTVNRMLTGSTVPEWDTMLFLKDTASPQDYDQAIFRLQNQYIKEYVGDDGKTIRFNMKPQTLLVDFDPDRVFIMQGQKAQVYNVNTDETGNGKLHERIEEELRISPIIVMNKDRITQIEATDIMKAVSEYSKTRGVAEETVEIPVDMSLLDIDAIRVAIERENELGSKSGLTIKAAAGDGDDMDAPEDDEPTDPTGTTGTATGTDTPTDTPTETTQKEEKGKDAVKQFRSYYARILFFAFLTKNRIISLRDIIACIDEPNNARIARNLGISKTVLEGIIAHADRFVINNLDNKILNLNQLSHDDSVDPVTRASVSVQKFGKLGESEVITPKHICKDMIGMIDDSDLRAMMDNGSKVLDIAGKAGEFALAVFEKYIALGYDKEALKDAIYTIPTSGITYEFTRMIYEILGLNVDNIASKFNSYSLLEVKDEDGDIDYERIAALLRQNKPFDSITMSDEVAEGDEKVIFDAVLGNPPYQLKGASGGTNDAPIYQHFVEVAYEAAPSFVSLIIPSKWFTTGREHLLGDFRRKMLGNRSIKNMVSYTDSHEVFPDVAIKGGICYFVHDKKYTGNCSYKLIQNGSENIVSRKLDEFDILIQDPRLESIVKKVNADITDASKSVASIISGDTPFGIPTNPKTSSKRAYSVYETSEPPHDTMLFYLENSSRKISYIDKSVITKNEQDIDKHKVLLPKAYGAGDSFPHQIVGQPEYAPANSVCSQTYLYASFATEIEATNFISYLKTRLFRALVLASKTSQDLPSKTYRFVPILDFTKPWSDAELYVKYGLTEEEIAFIESMIKPME